MSVPGAAFHCEVCGTHGMWRIERVGDVVTTWACPLHLSDACEAMQRDHEVTRLTVWHAAKSIEWAEIGERLRKVREGS